MDFCSMGGEFVGAAGLLRGSLASSSITLCRALLLLSLRVDRSPLLYPIVAFCFDRGAALHYEHQLIFNLGVSHEAFYLF